MLSLFVTLYIYIHFLLWFSVYCLVSLFLKVHITNCLVRDHTSLKLRDHRSQCYNT